MQVTNINNLSRLVLLGLVALCAACSDRERTNPLDPGNPDRNRANIGFNALAGNNQVLIEWNRLDFIDLAGTRVRRMEAGSTDTVTVSDTTLPFSATRFVDNSSKNGTTYSYHLMFDVVGSNEKPTTVPDTVTPGPVFSWVELIDYGEVVLFTPDFRDEVVSLEVSFYDVVDIQVGAVIWVLEAGGTIHRFQRTGELISSGDLLNVSAFVFDRLNGGVYVALAGESGLVYYFRANGDLVNSKATDSRITSLAIDGIANDLWFGSSDPVIGKLNVRASTNSYSQFLDPEFDKPELVVTASGKSGVWIGDRGNNQVINFNTTGIIWTKGGFSAVNDIAVDDAGDLCWVADAYADQVTVLNGSDGSVINKLSGFGNPFYLAYNRETNSVIVSGSTGKITSVSELGEINWSVQNPDRTGKIALAY
ncbi:MAG: hypothetical protein FVQ81_08350 [Candidatus Glassbacteria bacterium]|nr:hypothetical protein [Candidatus Glassbacteria bacterium]